MEAPPGDYRVELSEGGYLHEPVTVQAPAREVHLAVRPGASVQGSLVDARGLPLAAYSVRMVPREPKQRLTESSGVTDARGHFFRQGLKPGAYWLLACQETGCVERK